MKDFTQRNGWITYNDELKSEEGHTILYVTVMNGKNSSKKLRIWY